MWSVKSALPFVVSALTFAATGLPAEAKIIQYRDQQSGILLQLSEPRSD